MNLFLRNLVFCLYHISEMDKARIFTCKKNVYIWDAETESFYRLRGLDVGVRILVASEN